MKSFTWLALLGALSLLALIVPATASAKGNEVHVCHVTGGGSYHLIGISEKALPAHVAHGDGVVGGFVPDTNEEFVFGDDCGIEPAGPPCASDFTEGDDVVSEVAAGEVCYGLGGNDTVETNLGTFDGGDGDDSIVSNLGTVIGGEGRDIINLNQGAFDGGVGDDLIDVNIQGTFNGGEGNDVVVENRPAGLLDGGAGDDSIYTNDGAFLGGDGKDTVNNNTGFFSGHAGDDTVVQNRPEGTFDGGDDNDTVETNRGTFDGGPGFDSVTVANYGLCFDVEVGC